MNNETENYLGKKKNILKILRDKWELSGRPKNICIQLKEFEFSGNISQDDIAQILRAFHEKEGFIEDGYIFPVNIRLYKGKPISEEDPTPFITLYNEGYLRLHYLWEGLYIKNNEDKITLDINEKLFNHTIKKYEIDKLQPVIERRTEFLDDKGIIRYGNKKCQLPPYKNEYFFCQAMYEFPINEPVDWSIIYEKITGYRTDIFGKPKNTRENWRIVYDTMNRVNKRVREVLGIEKLFIWQEKTIRRAV